MRFGITINVAKLRAAADQALENEQHVRIGPIDFAGIITELERLRLLEQRLEQAPMALYIAGQLHVCECGCGALGVSGQDLEELLKPLSGKEVSFEVKELGPTSTKRDAQSTES